MEQAAFERSFKRGRLDGWGHVIVYVEHCSNHNTFLGDGGWSRTSGRGLQERKSSERGEMVFLIFSCASGPGSKEQGLCWSAASEQDDSGMRARGSTATCRTNSARSRTASMPFYGFCRWLETNCCSVIQYQFVKRRGLLIRGHWRVQA